MACLEGEAPEHPARRARAGETKREEREEENEQVKRRKERLSPEILHSSSLFSTDNTMSPSSQPFLVLPTHAEDGQQRELSSSATVKRRAYASLVLLVLAATAAMLLFDAAIPLEPASSRSSISTSTPPPPPPLPNFPSASCMHFVGGGAARPGGAFPQPRQRSPRCWPSVRAYFERGDYLADVAEAVGDAREVLRFYSRPSRDLVLVFDVDETSLSNADEWMTATESSASEEGGDGGEGERNEPLLFDLDPLAALERRALAASSPPLQATLAFYQDAYAAGFSVTFVTGRTDRDGMREATVRNLVEAGYGADCGSSGGGGGRTAEGEEAAAPCYLSLMMRSPGDVRPASVYKPEARAKLLLSGGGSGGGDGGGRSGNLTIVASLGDQFSDLVGPAGAHASFKLPNPVYAIL